MTSFAEKKKGEANAGVSGINGFPCNEIPKWRRLKSVAIAGVGMIWLSQALTISSSCAVVVVVAAAVMVVAFRIIF